MLNYVEKRLQLLIINKKEGMVVHPAPGNYTGTLVNALLYHCKDSLSGIGISSSNSGKIILTILPLINLYEGSRFTLLLIYILSIGIKFEYFLNY